MYDLVPEHPLSEFLVRPAVIKDVEIGMALNEPGRVITVFTISNLRDDARILTELFLQGFVMLRVGLRLLPRRDHLRPVADEVWTFFQRMFTRQQNFNRIDERLS